MSCSNIVSSIREAEKSETKCDHGKGMWQGLSRTKVEGKPSSII